MFGDTEMCGACEDASNEETAAEAGLWPAIRHVRHWWIKYAGHVSRVDKRLVMSLLCGETGWTQHD